jgi:hypothetical protein
VPPEDEPLDEPLDEPPEDELLDDEPPLDEPPEDDDEEEEEPPEEEPPEEEPPEEEPPDDPGVALGESSLEGSDGSAPNCDEPVGSKRSDSFAPPHAAAAVMTKSEEERSTRGARFMAQEVYRERGPCPMPRSLHCRLLSVRPGRPARDARPWGKPGARV